MSFTLRASVRPLVFAAFLAVASAGTALADGSYGGTDPPKSNDAVSFCTGMLDESAGVSCFWTQLSALFAQWFATLN